MLEFLYFSVQPEKENINLRLHCFTEVNVNFSGTFGKHLVEILWLWPKT
jgi:hypothetical protein